jgi:hypothetical protein
MGCDIHPGMFLVRETKWQTTWVDFAAVPHGDRNYQFFGLLAGVRDRDVKMIDEPRGLPGWWPKEEDYRAELFNKVLSREHSTSWVTLAELKKAEVNEFNGEHVQAWIDLAEVYQKYDYWKPTDEQVVFVFDFDS